MWKTVEELQNWANKRVQLDAKNRKKYSVKYKTDIRPVYEFKSKSDPAIIYKVYNTGSSWICNCPGFTFRRNCRHIREV